MAWIEQATLRSSPLISVVLATRDRAAHLRRAIDSVLAQTYDRFELLVVDDASEDETAAVIAAVRDGRVRGLRRRRARAATPPATPGSTPPEAS